MYEIRRPLSEKNLGHRNPYQVQERPQSKDQTRPNSSGSHSKAIQVMKSSVQLHKQNQNFYSKYFTSKDQKENLEIRANMPAKTTDRQNSTSKTPKELQEYKKLQDKLQYLENKITNIKSHIDSTQKQTKSSLASKFFSQNQKVVTQSTASLQTKHPETHKLKSSTLINPEPKVEGTILKKPSLSTFVTQIKPVSDSKDPKNLLNRPDSAKASQSVQKPAFSRRKNSSERQIPYQETSFLFYVSSIIRGYMAPDITKPIEQIREHLLQTMQAQQFAKSMKPTQQCVIEDKRTLLPPTQRKTIVFDLDETLIHCNESVKVHGDIVLPIKFPTGEVIEVLRSPTLGLDQHSPLRSAGPADAQSALRINHFHRLALVLRERRNRLLGPD